MTNTFSSYIASFKTILLLNVSIELMNAFVYPTILFRSLFSLLILVLLLLDLATLQLVERIMSIAYFYYQSFNYNYSGPCVDSNCRTKKSNKNKNWKCKWKKNPGHILDITSKAPRSTQNVKIMDPLEKYNGQSFLSEPVMVCPPSYLRYSTIICWIGLNRSPTWVREGGVYEGLPLMSTWCS